MPRLGCRRRRGSTVEGRDRCLGPGRSRSIEIASEDVISDDGQEVYNLMQDRGIDNVILMGVHTNICVSGRPFGLRQMVYHGKNVVLCRDLTDSFFQPSSPEFNHFRGTDLIVEHIEKRFVSNHHLHRVYQTEPAFRFREDTGTVRSETQSILIYTVSGGSGSGKRCTSLTFHIGP